jgi:hypothetical protein
MTFVTRTLLLLPALALAGCAVSSYCEDEQKYQKAVSYPPLQPVEGIKLPDSQAALRVPPAPPNAIAFGERYIDEDGDEAVRCLDKPPLIPPPTVPKPAEAPAAAPAAPEAAPAETPAQPPE